MNTSAFTDRTSEKGTPYSPGQRVRVAGREDLGIGEVLRVSDIYGVYQADIIFETSGLRRLESFPVERLEHAPDLWERLKKGMFDDPNDVLFKQLAFQFPLQNKGGQLSNSRTQLLPHQILLTRDVVASHRRRYLIADEVGLGKTIEIGMILRELESRREASRMLIIAPAGLIKNWQQELRDAFRLHFEILGIDFMDHGSTTWEMKSKVIVSIDTIKRSPRLDRLLAGPRWDVIVFDEAHHLSRNRYGKKIVPTQNYRLAESLRSHTRDFLLLSATPHQGNTYQFWSLIQLLNDSLFDSEEAMIQHRGLLNQVMIRRTKREVTDRHGNPIFMRRQVHTERFLQSARERMFYEKLTEYLKEGYSVARIGETKVTTEERAIGFVMTTFQKIMSSSIRAIRQALRRRLLVLLIRHYMELEQKRSKRGPDETIDRKILEVQDEMRMITSHILGIDNIAANTGDIDAFIAQTRQKVSRKFLVEESTLWSLDADEEAEEELYATVNIPDEIRKVRSLISVIPDGRDRKFETLINAIESIRQDNPSEKFVIFTQYIETLKFLEEELGALYGKQKIAIIRGGPLENKIEAVERFWDERGAQFLICTSAGGEGINLQIGRILFNYDLPWNPMAVEQRIGRIHRFGQKETAQIYNLIAEDTVEEHIYDLLNRKLREIASQIGKVDSSTGEPREDFRNEILGFLGSSPSYLDLYKRAILDRDYRRTEHEIEEAIRKAREASEALSSFTQDLDSFDLRDYLAMEGSFTLDHLMEFIFQAVLRLEGAVLPRDEFHSIQTPPSLLRYPSVSAKYDTVTFDRDAAMRKKSVEFLGLGHPFVDAVVEHFQQSAFPGDVSCISRLSHEQPYTVFLTLITIGLEDGTVHQELNLMRVTQSGDAQVLPDHWLFQRFEQRDSLFEPVESLFDFMSIRMSYESAIGAILTQMKASMINPISARLRLLGVLNVA